MSQQLKNGPENNWGNWPISALTKPSATFPTTLQPIVPVATLAKPIIPLSGRFGNCCGTPSTGNERVDDFYRTETMDPIRIFATQRTSNNTPKSDVYLEIQRGEGPFSNTVNSPVNIGDTISLVVRAKTTNIGLFFIFEYFRSFFSLVNIHTLIGRLRCTTRPQLAGTMSRKKDGDQTFYYFPISAFRFPGPDDVYFTCAVDMSSSYNFPV
ncbi:unnamed protein product [Toxocara canis]|uniref:ZP domain-containing protein n=1 Tax=Toxocara canis TaxID=6265 RepID=A0A183UHS0_TOXCA|nr:unnamed protein product [Toxocara canis]